MCELGIELQLLIAQSNPNRIRKAIIMNTKLDLADPNLSETSKKTAIEVRDQVLEELKKLKQPRIFQNIPHFKNING